MGHLQVINTDVHQHCWSPYHRVFRDGDDHADDHADDDTKFSISPDISSRALEPCPKHPYFQ